MAISDDTRSFNDKLNGILTDYKLFYDSLRRLKCIDGNKSLIQKNEEYLKNEDSRLQRIKAIYDDFSNQFNQISEKYVSAINCIEEENRKEVEELKNDFENMKDEIKRNNEELKKKSFSQEKEPSFIYKNYMKSRIDAELVQKYPGSYLYREYMSDRRTANGDVFIDYCSENDELIVKYMKNDESLIEDLKKMNFEERNKLLEDMDFLELPIQHSLIKEMGCSEDDALMEAWRNNRVVMVNNENRDDFNMLLQRYNLTDLSYKNEPLKNIQYDEQTHLFYINLNMKFMNVIEDYMMNGKLINKELIKENSVNGNYNELINEMRMIGIELNEEERRDIYDCFDNRYLQGSKILLDTQYDNKLREWLGNNKWILLYRASEHGYTAKSFHEYCDDKGPTLVIIKSRKGWIFGGYTTQSWNPTIQKKFIFPFPSDTNAPICKDDDKAFIFTLKNPHGVEPTRYMKRKRSKNAINCNLRNGPTFGAMSPDIYISNYCSAVDSCWISSSSCLQYECHPNHKSSLYVNTGEPDNQNKFTVMDYEVYATL